MNKQARLTNFLHIKAYINVSKHQKEATIPLTGPVLTSSPADPEHENQN